jgi:tannase/feruloyl esterase
MRLIRLLALLAAALSCLWLANPASAAEPNEQCDTETVQGMAPADTTVAFAARQGAGCQVVGFVTTRNPGPNRVQFVLALPNAFNGRYVYLGVGGAAGELPVVRPELYAKGYAVSGSDGGTGAKHWADFSFKSGPGKLADFQGRGVLQAGGDPSLHQRLLGRRANGPHQRAAFRQSGFRWLRRRRDAVAGP